MVKYAIVSSAKLLTLDHQQCHLCKKETGPSTDPWGTPETTGTSPEETPSSKTDCVRFFRKFWIQVLVAPSVPYNRNFSTLLVNLWEYRGVPQDLWGMITSVLVVYQRWRKNLVGLNSRVDDVTFDYSSTKLSTTT